MTLKRLAPIFCLLLIPFTAHSQQATLQNPQALALLTQSLNAAGGSSATSGIQDFTGAGTITYNWANAQVQAPVTVKSMGITTFRVDSSLNSGTQTWAVDGMAGVLISPDGSRRNSAFYNLTIAGSLTIPALRIVSILQSPSTGVSYVGQVTINGSAAYQIHCVLATNSSTSTSSLPAFGTFDLYLDATSLLVVSIQETAYSESNSQVSLTHELDFSNYQTVEGAVVPFGIVEKIGGQQTWSISLNSLSFNSGLTEAVFTP